MCGCNSDITICQICQHSCADCCCPTQAVPDVDCPDGEPCIEIYPAGCVEFTDPVACESQEGSSNDASDLYPDVTHTLVPESPAADRRLDKVITNVNTQLCYIFSKGFIQQMLTIIQNDEELLEQFCAMVCSCPCGNPRCDAATNLTVVMTAGASATVTWDPGLGATSQKLQFRAKGTSTWNTVPTTAGDTSESISGLTDNKIYEFRMVTVCGEIEVPTLNEEAIAMVCYVPVLETTADQASVAFTIPAGTSIDTIDIVLKQGGSIVGSTTVSNTGNILHTFTGLNPATAYSVEITLNAGSFSKTCTYELKTDSATCANPTNPTVTLTNVT